MSTTSRLNSLVMMVGFIAMAAPFTASMAAPAASETSLSGIVTDAAGKPVRGANVKATMADKSITRYTDSAGRYQIQGLKPGPQEVVVDAFGFAIAQRTVTLAKSSETNFSLSTEMDLTRLTSAEMRFLFPDTRGEYRIYARCSNCHGLELVVKHTGMPAAAWQGFLPYMTIHRWGLSQGFTPSWAATLAPSLDTMFGPNGILGPNAHPDYSKVKYTPLEDEALKATVTEYTIPSKGAMPHSVRVDSRSGIVWFSDYDAASNNIVRFDPKTESFREFPIPLPRALAHTGIVLRDGRYMVGLDRGGVERGQVPTKLAVADSDGHVETLDWAERPGGARVVELDPVKKDFVWIVAGTETWHLNVKTKEMRVYQNPLPATFPAKSIGALTAESGISPSAAGYDLAIDSHGIPWVTQIDVATIFRLDPETGATKTYNTPEMRSARGIKIDNQDNIWFGDYYGAKLGMLDPKTGQFKFYPTPTPYASPYGITIDHRRGYVWYADTAGNRATRFDPKTKQFVEYALGTRNSAVRFMGVDPRGRIWYGGFFSGKLGMIDPGYSDDKLLSAR